MLAVVIHFFTCETRVQYLNGTWLLAVVLSEQKSSEASPRWIA